MAGWWLIADVHYREVPLPMPRALVEAGVAVDGRIQLRTDRGARGSGLFINKAVAKGTTLIRVPVAAVLSGELAQEVLGPSASSLEPEVALCALLAEARRDAELSTKSSQDLLGLREYLQALPVAFPSVPLWLSEEEAAAALRGTCLFPASRAMRRQAEEDRQAVISVLGNCLKAVWSEKRWLWAKVALLTRAGPAGSLLGDISDHDVEADAESNGVRFAAIVPLIDFANCDADPSAECKQDLSSDILLVARRDLPAGAEITISYGDQCQEQLLFTFGFALPGGFTDGVSTPLPLMPRLGSEEEQLRAVLCGLLASAQDSNGGAGRSALVARLKWMPGADQEVDCSELFAAANIHKMEVAELRKVAAEAAKQDLRLPNFIFEGVVGDEPAAMLRQILQEWTQDLAEWDLASERFRRRANPALDQLLAYRAECLALARAALRRLEGQAKNSIGGDDGNL